MRGFFTQDIGWKIFSLVLAVVIWFTVDSLRDERGKTLPPLGGWKTRTFTDLPVMVVSAASDARALAVQPVSVAVTVRGEPALVDALVAREIRVTVDLSEIQSAWNLRKRLEVFTPAGITFIEAVPPDVEVILPPPQS